MCIVYCRENLAANIFGKMPNFQHLASFMFGGLSHNLQSLTLLFKWLIASIESIAAVTTIMLTVPPLQRTHQLRAGDSQHEGPLHSGSNAYRSTVGVQLLWISSARHFSAWYLNVLSGYIKTKSPSSTGSYLCSAIHVASRASRYSVPMAKNLVWN